MSALCSESPTDDMEQETGRILRTLTERTIGSRDTIALKDILTARIPPGIKTFLQADIMDELERELIQNQRFTRVSISAPGIPGVVKGFIRTCALEYVVPRAELVASLDNATHFLGNYVCRPQWTLREFLFGEDTSLSQAAFIGKLQYTSDYPYYKTILHAMMLRKGWKKITVEQFGRVVDRADRLMLQQLGARELAELTQPIFDFFALSGLRPDGRIPLKPLVVFFNDKKQHTLTGHLERICAEHSKSEVSLADLINLFEQLEEAAQANEGTLLQHTPQEPEDHVAGAATIQDVDTDIPTHHTANTPGVEDPGRSAPGDSPERSDTVMQPPHHIQRNVNLNAALALTYAGIAASSGASLPDISSLIPPGQREIFVNRIFGKDEAYYAGVIDALDHTHTWKEASLYLNTFYEDHGLDPFADEVVQFTDIIQQRYASDQAAGK